MIVTEQQRKTLYTYLSDGFNYRETVTEVYDHILSAMEHEENELVFEDAVTSIINCDFGGVKNLRSFENKLRVTASEEARRLLIKKFKDNLVFPGILIAFIIGAMVYYKTAGLLAPDTLIGIYLGMSMIFVAHIFWRPFRSGYLYKDNRKSVKDHILNNTISLPFRFSFLISLWHPLIKITPASLHDPIYYFFALLVYLVIPLYLLSYFQIFKKEYLLKPDFTNS